MENRSTGFGKVFVNNKKAYLSMQTYLLGPTIAEKKRKTAMSWVSKRQLTSLKGRKETKTAQKLPSVTLYTYTTLNIKWCHYSLYQLNAKNTAGSMVKRTAFSPWSHTHLTEQKPELSSLRAVTLWLNDTTSHNRLPSTWNRISPKWGGLYTHWISKT